MKYLGTFIYLTTNLEISFKSNKKFSKIKFEYYWLVVNISLLKPILNYYKKLFTSRIGNTERDQTRLYILWYTNYCHSLSFSHILTFEK